METKNTAGTREIPTPPAGGSWRFDEANWQWVRAAGPDEADHAAPEEQSIQSQE